MVGTRRRESQGYVVGKAVIHVPSADTHAYLRAHQSDATGLCDTLVRGGKTQFVLQSGPLAGGCLLSGFQRGGDSLTAGRVCLGNKRSYRLFILVRRCNVSQRMDDANQDDCAEHQSVFPPFIQADIQFSTPPLLRAPHCRTDVVEVCSRPVRFCVG